MSTGIRQTGPYRHRRGSTISALGGWAYTFSDTGREPLQVGFPALHGGLYSAIGALAALRERRVDGDSASTSPHEALTNMLSYPQVLEQFGCPPLRRNFSASLQTFYVETRDGWIALNHLSPGQWESTCILLGLPHLAADPTLLSDMERKRAIVPEFMAAATEWARDLTQMRPSTPPSNCRSRPAFRSPAGADRLRPAARPGIHDRERAAGIG